MGLPAHITRVLRRRGPFFARTMILRYRFLTALWGESLIVRYSMMASLCPITRKVVPPTCKTYLSATIFMVVRRCTVVKHPATSDVLDLT